MAEDPFQPLRQEYLTKARTTANDLERLARSAPTDPGARAELRRLAHNLRGSGGFFGFQAITAAAASLEELLIAAEQGAAPSAADLRHATEQLCEAIRTAKLPGT